MVRAVKHGAVAGLKPGTPGRTSATAPLALLPERADIQNRNACCPPRFRRPGPVRHRRCVSEPDARFAFGRQTKRRLTPHGAVL